MVPAGLVNQSVRTPQAGFERSCSLASGWKNWTPLWQAIQIRPERRETSNSTSRVASLWFALGGHHHSTILVYVHIDIASRRLVLRYSKHDMCKYGLAKAR